MKEIRMESPELAITPDNQPLALLKERSGQRIITLTLNSVSAHFLDSEINGLEYPRPQIFKFVTSCLQALRASIEKVVIREYDTEKHMYLSHVVIRDFNQNYTYNLALHVADAVILAVSTKSPIFVVETVFKEVEKARQEAINAYHLKILEDLSTSNITKH